MITRLTFTSADERNEFMRTLRSLGIESYAVQAFANVAKRLPVAISSIQLEGHQDIYGLRVHASVDDLPGGVIRIRHP